MKSILICPNQPSGIPALAGMHPLATIPILGESFLSYWLEYLAGHGVQDLRFVTMEDPEELHEAEALASRWGVKLRFHPEQRDLTREEVISKYRVEDVDEWAASPLDVIELDHLPGHSGHSLFLSYADFYQSICAWLPQVTRTKRIGLRELQPGIWVGQRARIARSARLQAPCWIGENVQVGKDAQVGPFAFLEDRVVVEDACEITQSWVGPDTFLGTLTRVEGSLAWGSTLVNWATGSHTTVPDDFLMCSLARKRAGRNTLRTRPGTVPEPSLARPVDVVISIAQKLQG